MTPDVRNTRQFGHVEINKPEKNSGWVLPFGFTIALVFGINYLSQNPQAVDFVKSLFLSTSGN